MDVKCFTINNEEGPYVTIKSINDFLESYGLDPTRFADTRRHTGTVITQLMQEVGGTPFTMKALNIDQSCLSYILKFQHKPTDLINELILSDLITTTSIKYRTEGDSRKWVQVLKLPLLKVFLQYIGLNKIEIDLIKYCIYKINMKSSYIIDPFTFNKEINYPLFVNEKKKKRGDILKSLPEKEQMIVRNYFKLCKQLREVK